MKKPLLFSLGLILVISASSQTIIFEDDFESYTAGMGLAAQTSDWSVWHTGTDTDAVVDDTQSVSGDQSVLIDGTSTDLVLPIGPYNGSGKYDVVFKMMIEEGAGGYFNLLHMWTAAGTTYEWAVDVYFSGTGEVTWTTGAEAGGAAQINPGEWFDVKVAVDLDNDIGKLYIEGEEVHEWQWSLDNADGSSGMNQLAAVNFYGTNDTTSGNGTYWIDDVQVINSTGVAIANVTGNAVPSFFPNPANNQISFTDVNAWKGGIVRVMDLAGKVVLSENLTTDIARDGMDISSLQDGIYLVRFSDNNDEYTRKLIVRH